MPPPPDTETAQDDPPASDLSAPEAQAAFRSACEQHLDFVWRFAGACGVDPPALEYVVHKVFGVLQGRLISLEDPSELRVSVAGITRHVVRGYLRQLGTPLEALGQAEMQDQSDGGRIEGLEKKTDRELVDLILAKMNDTEREVFILCESEGFSLFETAEALHVSESTLAIRLEDARKIFNDVSARLRAQRFWLSREGAGKP